MVAVFALSKVHRSMCVRFYISLYIFVSLSPFPCYCVYQMRFLLLGVLPLTAGFTASTGSLPGSNVNGDFILFFALYFPA